MLATAADLKAGVQPYFGLGLGLRGDARGDALGQPLARVLRLGHNPGMTTTAAAPSTPSRRTSFRMVDCDVHHMLASNEVLSSYLPARWARYNDTYGLRYPDSIGYFATRPRHFACRSDAWPEDGVPGSDLAFMREQHLDRYEIDAAILNAINMTTCGTQFPEFAAALARALNDWTLDEWLEKDDRLYSSIGVPCEDAALAVEEVRRVGAHPRFLQVLLNVRSREPLGNRKYWPLYEACVEHDLPLAFHVGGHGGNTITGAGWPSYYFEDHAGYPQSFQAQVISLVVEGVFDRYPTLKVIMQEGGFAWLPALMWRLDTQFERLRDEASHLQRKPSDYVREHFWFTTQPIEEPERPGDFMRILEHLDMNDHALFASDYPHWDFDDPINVFPNELPDELKARWYSGNAYALYPKLPHPT
jgi:predicted TIM-barrel fold metal-dependent hydrolase